MEKKKAEALREELEEYLNWSYTEPGRARVTIYENGMNDDCSLEVSSYSEGEETLFKIDDVVEFVKGHRGLSVYATVGREGGGRYYVKAVING